MLCRDRQKQGLGSASASGACLALVLIWQASVVSAVVPYQGTRCHKHSTYPGGECPVPGACGHNGSCIFWKAGQIVPPLTGRSLSSRSSKSAGGASGSGSSSRSSRSTSSSGGSGSNHSRDGGSRSSSSSSSNSSSGSGSSSGSSRKLPICNDTDVKGAPSKEDGRWAADSSANCQFRYITQASAYRCLRGKRVMVMGDSLMRQLAIRLIALLRGLPQVVDHYFHNDFIYINNGSNDTVSLNKQLAPYNESLGRAQAGDDTVELMFAWKREKISVDLVSSVKPDILVVGINYWTRELCPWITDRLDSIANSSSKTSVYWLSTPAPAWSANWEVKRKQRNGMVKQHILDKRKQGRKNHYYLPSDRMAEFSNYPRVKDDHVHFGCRSSQKLDLQVEYPIKKAPPNGRCDDLLNLSLLQMILSVECPD